MTSTLDQKILQDYYEFISTVVKVVNPVQWASTFGKLEQEPAAGEEAERDALVQQVSKWLFEVIARQSTLTLVTPDESKEEAVALGG